MSDDRGRVPPDTGEGSGRDDVPERDWKLETRAAHAGKSTASPPGTPTSVPIFAASAFEQPDAAAIDAVFEGSSEGYVYGRYHNPTVDAFESAVAELEGAEDCAAFSSGMAAIAAAFAAADLPQGAKVMAGRDLYGTSITWLEDAASIHGWDLVYVDTADRPFSTKSIREEKPSVVYVETLSNPLVRVTDLGAIGPACRDAGSVLIVDATFTPPPLLRPIENGATMVVHSATKYIGGHGDLVAGVVSGSREHIGRARARRKLDGTIADPFSAWLALRGLRTLPLRIARQCDNAAAVARHLHTHHLVGEVHYPGLGHRDSQRERQLLDRLFPDGRYGAMLAFDLVDGTMEMARRFLDALELFGTATTLGDLHSLALLPAMTSHRGLPEERRQYMGITDGLVRLSIGIEDPDDLVADLDRALRALE